ncbi:MAG: TonB-dependent receptor [Acidobacteria bacterium]|nr:TonB-dependent receptor [Acidobacteriota bacterium]
MKKSFIVLSLLLFAVTLTAQVRTGTIYGKVTDTEGNPLPGVSITLTSPQIGALTTVTGATGVYRFISLSPNNYYEIKAELTGFKKAAQTGIIVQIGSNAEINLIMEVGTLEEQVTVVAKTPVIDTKKTTVGQNVDKEIMQSLPTARDPWVVIQLAPSIMIDRENVGGNESGQQSAFLTKGDNTGARYSGNDGANNLWAVDGIDVTDPSALGGSAGYYDFDMFEELQIQTGGAADVTIQTGGVALNMVTRRGGNKMSLAGRFYLTDNFFQSENLTPDLIARGVTRTNKIQQIKDFGFNAGGPIIKDKLWWWGAYGVQDVFVYTITGAKDQSLLNNYNVKVNAQLLPNNRFEALLSSGAKEKFGRNDSVEKPGGDHQTGKYHWGSPVIKLQDEHVFGNNFFVSLKYSFNDAGFGWRPIGDESLLYPVTYDSAGSKYIPYASGMGLTWQSYLVSRPRNNYQIQATYFNDTILGISHEIKVGAEYSHKVQTGQSSHFQGYTVTRNYNSLQLDANADGSRVTSEMAGWQYLWMSRDARFSQQTDQWAAYLQDTMVKGNFTLTLGLRFDKQWPGAGATTFGAIFGNAGDPYETAWKTVFSDSVISTLDSVLPDITTEPVKGVGQIVNGEDRPYQWNTFSPRIGLTWDITGDGKTVAKLALSQYGDVMGTGWRSALPRGTGGTMRYWWNDGNGVTANKDGKAQFNEMYWGYSARNPVADPANPGLPYRYVPYRVFDDSGNLTAAAAAMLGGASIWNSDAYYAGYVSGFDWNDPLALDYTSGITTYFQDRGAQTDSRTREILLTLEREIIPDFSAQINLTYRKYDRNTTTLNYYPAEHSSEYPTYTGPEIIDPADQPAGGYWVEGGTIPDNYIIGGTWSQDISGNWINTGGTTYSSGDAAGLPYYVAGLDYPTTTTSYRLVRLTDAYYTYYGVDLVFNKRLSNKWFMNGSFTWQDQRTHWGNDFFDPTNQWSQDGKTFAEPSGSQSGKLDAVMFTSWMVKFSGLYQLPFGFNISGTFNAREGWKIPNYFVINDANVPNYAADHSATMYTRPITTDSLPTFYNITLRLEKKINIGAGRLYLMADVFNLLNSNMPNRQYSRYPGTAYFCDNNGEFQQYSSSSYALNNTLYEILNPRIWRFGVRFEF